MAMTLIRKPSIMVIGIECRTSNDPEKGPRDIPRLWDRFYAEKIFSFVPNKASTDVVALYCDYEGDRTKPYTVVIGCPVTSLDEVPKGMVGKMIPTSTMALFKAEGEFPKSVIETWNQIWNCDLKRAYTFDCEVYGAKFASPQKEVDIYIALQDKEFVNTL